MNNFKENLKIVLKPIWFPAILLFLQMKDIGGDMLYAIRNDRPGDIAGGVFAFSVASGLVVAVLAMFSFIFVKIWLALIIISYLSVFYIRDHYKRHNK